MRQIRRRTIQNISKILCGLVLASTGLYIAFVYNTVITVSKTEVLKNDFQKVEVAVSQKEHEYIQSVATINMEYALAAGYVRVPEDKLAYVDLKEETSLAIR